MTDAPHAGCTHAICLPLNGDGCQLDQTLTFDEMLDALGGVRIRFWMCPIPGHSDRTGPDGRPVVTVEWDGDVARCTTPGCERTNQTSEATP
ncbi:hypothetical protein ACFYUR_18585 [Micromonospora haikouensis]|uniref:hypothetical protein n=1 Tax=Micromonospora haikouensis TaxID=686309 RepID=UPI0036BFD6B9